MLPGSQGGQGSPEAAAEADGIFDVLTALGQCPRSSGVVKSSRRWWWHLSIGSAIVFFVVVAVGIPVLYGLATWRWGEVCKLAPTSVGAGTTLAAAILALAQYHRNSRDKRVERSMSFWQRTNTSEFTKHLTPYLKRLRKLDDKPTTTRGFEQLALRDAANDRKLNKHIEYLLDFYDEACTGVLAGACDEQAMFDYLGGVMVREANALVGYVPTRVKMFNRKEKWSAFIRVTEFWIKGYCVDTTDRIESTT